MITFFLIALTLDQLTGLPITMIKVGDTSGYTDVEVCLRDAQAMPISKPKDLKIVHYICVTEIPQQ